MSEAGRLEIVRQIDAACDACIEALAQTGILPETVAYLEGHIRGLRREKDALREECEAARARARIAEERAGRVDEDGRGGRGGPGQGYQPTWDSGELHPPSGGSSVMKPEPFIALTNMQAERDQARDERDQAIKERDVALEEKRHAVHDTDSWKTSYKRLERKVRDTVKGFDSILEEESRYGIKD